MTVVQNEARQQKLEKEIEQSQARLQINVLIQFQKLTDNTMHKDGHWTLLRVMFYSVTI